MKNIKCSRCSAEIILLEEERSIRICQSCREKAKQKKMELNRIRTRLWAINNPDKVKIHYKTNQTKKAIAREERDKNKSPSMVDIFKQNQENIKKDYDGNLISVKQICEKYKITRAIFNHMRKELKIPKNQLRTIENLKRVATCKRTSWRKGKSTYFLWLSKYGKQVADEKNLLWKERLSKKNSGNGNPMYGKPCPIGRNGHGYSGWYKEFHFRSLGELMFIINMEKDCIEIKTGESLLIPYYYNNLDYTYRPDFIIGNRIIEIKPTRLQKDLEVVAKKEAAERYCKLNNLFYQILDIKVDIKTIYYNLIKNNIKFHKNYETQFLNLCAKNGLMIMY
jgi:DNA-directed RNA polymerase subunit RPC12/RpoP